MSSFSDEDRLLRAVQEYQCSLELGRPLDRAAFLARHADLEELAGYLDTLDTLHVPTPPPGPLSAEPLGDFRIVREIGRGGMGVVYEAEQLSLGRRVALKVLPFAQAFDSRQLARFHNEARAAAALHHTNIVPVFAVGCERGVHFYAMQLIEGRTLGELISDLRRHGAAAPGAETVVAAGTEVSSDPEKSEASDRAIARLMVQAARALDHAHQHGVVHRDVKPANLMLDRSGQLWVTDFGLAQLQTDAELTRTGDLVGTLRYMSPEQASGQRLPLDPRTDLYSLGATFYELLTLEPIFPGPGRAELLRQISSEEPRSPRSLRKSIPVELETILLECLSKTASERYASAGELADDLERFLGHRPILARRPTLFERGRKWARRHPGVVAVAAVLLVLCTVGSLVGQALLAREQARTRDALLRERIRSEQVERRLTQAKLLIDVLIQVGEEELDDRPTSQGLRKRLLETALGQYQALIDDSDDPASTAGLAASRARVRQLLDDLSTLQRVDRAMLLGIESVLDELRPGNEQRRTLRDLIARLRRERLDTLFDRELTPAQKRQRQLEQARASEQALAAILTPAQQTRLRQVSLYVQGLLAFRDPDVVAALELTPGQRTRLREIEGECHGPGRPPNQSRLREGLERCLAVLTPRQRARWTELTGPPFDAPMPHMPGHLFGPGGRPPGPPGREKRG